MKLSIIIPAHNEAELIEKTVCRIVGKVNIQDYEIIICNDHSTDNTLEIANSIARRFGNIRVLSNDGPKGFGNVIRFGFNNAIGDYVVLMMADLCDDPDTVNSMVPMMDKGYDVVVGSRYIRGGKKINIQNHFKSFCSWGIGFIGWHILRIKTHDSTNAFKMIRRDIIKKINVTSNNFDISLELTVKLYRAGAKMTEVPTIWIDRSEGSSKFNMVVASKRYIRWLK